ncbi:Ig-like domain-containing protein [Aliikangiella coralliicola]|uniref:Tandem-95 repeat protein n=1 Tax=Aliikangiella coralliicola TaxID=2592383 RepID=A0A545U7U8_9GAMM|nr:Ig-like domain-containing protein [Aliikangiella coralliicola]TQV85539.1 tandem-95 repeat protein [Aliikangiella coralliicola]
MTKKQSNKVNNDFNPTRSRSSLSIQRVLLCSAVFCGSTMMGSFVAAQSGAAEKGLPKSAPAIAELAAKRVDDRVEKRVYKGAELVAVATPSSFDGDIRDLPAMNQWAPGDAVKVANPRRIGDVAGLLPPVNRVKKTQQALVNRQKSSRTSVTDLQVGVKVTGFEFNGVNPPDPTGEVGEKYYIHSINASGGSAVTIFDKTNGNKVGDAFTMSSLASAGDCQNGLGDPIIVYDEYAKRWLLTEFSQEGPNKLCVYVSKTSDPVTGGWYAYEFAAPTFPDYPKYSVWGGNYYVSANESGGAVYALDRAKMLAGEPASMVRKTVPSLAGFGFQSISPVDADGLNPPADGTPGLFIRHRDDELHNSGSNNGEKDFLELWTFTPDFANADNSKLEGPFNIEISELDSNFTCPDGFGCLTQKPEEGQTLSTLDPLKEVVNYKPQYRNFNSHQSITGSFVTKLEGNNAGLRWFELRKTDADWTLHQEGIVPSSDNNSRYMSGAAMDGDGNMALAYMITGAEQFPSIRVTGRRMGDALGTISSDEITLVEADGSIATERDGDYSHMSVDPIDNCTFWYTAEHGGAGAKWKTGIASFKFPGCTGVGSTDPGFSMSATNRSQEICREGAMQPIAVTVTGYNNFDKNVTLSYADLAQGLSGQFSVNPVSAGASSNATVTVASGTAAGDYTFSINGAGEGVDSRSVSASVKVVDAEQTATLSSPANGAEKVDDTPELEWTSSGYVRTYTIEIATDEGFSNIIATGSVSSGTKYRPSSALPQSTKVFWRVKASNACGDTLSNVFSFTTGSDKDKAEALTVNVAKSIQGAEGESADYYIDVPAGVEKLTVETSGGEGDVDLYMGFGRIPKTADDLVCRSESDGMAESCEITDVKEGTYFIVASAYAAYSGSELIAKYEIPNSLPNAVNDEFTIKQGTSGHQFDVIANDTDADEGDTLTLDSVSYSGTGSAAVTDGKIVYTPASDFSGTETFTYVVKDNKGGTGQGTVTVVVTPNVAPQAVNDSVTVKQDSTNNQIDVLANDTDADQGDTLTLDSINYSGSGTATISGGKVSYTPAKDFHGTETFTYTVKDAAGASAQGTVTITVEKKPSSGSGSTGLFALLMLPLVIFRRRFNAEK